MDYDTNNAKLRNPIETANFFKKLFFLYTLPLFKTGRKRDLQIDDVYNIVPEFASKKLGDKLEERWSLLSINQTAVSLYKLMWLQYGKSYLLLGIVQLVFRTSIVLLQPIVLARLLNYFKDPYNIPKGEAYKNGLLLIFINTAACIYNHNYMQLVTEFGIRVRTAFTTLIYRKVLKMTPTALSEITVGKVVTLMTKDVYAFDRIFIFLNDLWIGLIQTSIICYMMYAKVGISVFAGLGCLVLLVPLQLYMGKKLTHFRIAIGKKTDQRIQLTQEALSAIKIIKMYTWEQFFYEQITKARKQEMKTMVNIYYFKALGIIIPVLNSKISFYLLVMTYIWLGNIVEAPTIFFIITCYGSLRSYLLNTIPFGIMSLAELQACLKRLKVVFSAEELKKNPPISPKPLKPLVHLNKIAVKLQDKDILSYVDMELHSGLNVISGDLGCGKSSLLKTILKDYPIYKGFIDVQGTISYAEEDPWLFPSTIKQNILFGQKLNEQRYHEILRVCALTKELQTFLNGDNTIVGDKGTNLSNGQKARISLARACYKDSDIYLLDDCLKSLDSNVSKFVFHECLRKFLKDKLIVFVTNNVHYIKQADNTIIMVNGKTPTIRKQKELLDKRITFYMDDEDQTHFENEKSYIDQEPSETDALLEKDVKPVGKIYGETMKTGKVSNSVYSKYMAYYGGICIVFIVMFLFITFQIATSYSDKLVSTWVILQAQISNLSVKSNSNATLLEEKKEEFNSVISLYTILIFASAALAIFKSFSHFYFSSKSSVKLHNKMTYSVLNSIMQFFDQNKIGNLLNRFSKDLAGIDEFIPFLLYEIFRVMCTLSGIIIVIATVNKYFLIPAAILIIKLYFIRLAYIPVGRSLKRLDAATRSPMVGHINASIEGLTTIRAYKMESIVQNEFDNHLDLFTSAWYMMQCTMRTFGFYLDLTCNLFVASVTIHFLFLNSDAQAANVGLAITQAMGLTGLLQWGIRQWSELESQMTSVERVVEYTTNEQENRKGRVVGKWPSKGKIEYRGVYLRYNKESQWALKNVNFVIEGGTKVGIVGRTGAGKSSIISALFRLYRIDGSIFIDDVNIRTVELDCLRSKIAIIPQDPVLFTGTIRSNIDPLGKYTDMEIWTAIEKMNLKELVQSLDFKVEDAGKRYSSGQRQLICLARAFVSKNKVIVLDEATANMMPELDDVLQKTIKKCFGDCTILTVAHRLHSVMNSDLVMVIQDGAIQEYDTPDNLLINKSGLFYTMAQQANEIN